MTDTTPATEVLRAVQRDLVEAGERLNLLASDFGPDEVRPAANPVSSALSKVRSAMRAAPQPAPFVNWPQPKHVPVPSGSKLNPQRVGGLLAAIKQELVAGEMLDLADRLYAEFAEDAPQPAPDREALVALIAKEMPRSLGDGMEEANRVADALLAAGVIRDPQPETATALDDLAALGQAHDKTTQPETLAWADVLAERQRQISAEGWTPADDDLYERGDLATAAGCYILHPVLGSERELLWPWDERWWKPTDRRRDLVKAGALILAEIERLDRSAEGEAK